MKTSEEGRANAVDLSIPQEILLWDSHVKR